MTSALPLFASDAPQTFTLDGRLLNGASGPAAGPLIDPNVTLILSVLDSSKTCILYEESQNISTVPTDGYFSVEVGSDTAATKRTTADSGLSMTQVFQNKDNLTGKLLSDGVTACNVTAASGSTRYLRTVVQASTIGGGAAKTLSPDLAVGSVPTAIIATRAESVQGYTSDQLLKVNTSGSNALTQANLESVFSTPAKASAVAALADGTSTLYVSNSTTVGARLPAVSGTPASATTGSIWYDTADNQLKYRNAGGTTVPLVSGSSSGMWTEASGDVYRATGRVGIGTTSPSLPLTLSFTGAGSGYLVPNTPQHAGFNFYAPNIGANGFAQTLDISAVGTQNSSAGGGEIRFLTNPANSNNAVERMVITKIGYVGIGVNPPTGILDVQGGANSSAPINLIAGSGWSTGGNAVLAAGGANNTLAGSVTLRAGATSASGSGGSVQIAAGQGPGANGTITFNHINSSSTLTERVRIDGSGNLGIGTAAPTERLDVNGAIRIGSTTNANTGTLRWDGTNFQGYTGSSWVNFVPNPPASGSCDDVNTYSVAGTYGYTVPANFARLTIRMWGGGGGGGAANGSGTIGNGGVGGTTSIASLGLFAGGGAGGIGTDGSSNAPGAAGGTASGGSTNTSGGSSSIGTPYVFTAGGNSPNGGVGGTSIGGSGSAPGGGGAGLTNGGRASSGGGGGAYLEKVLTSMDIAPGTFINGIVVASGGAGGNGGGGAGGTGRVSISCSTAGAPPVNDRSIVFQSAGAYSADTNFVFGSTGNLGVGTSNPQQKVEVNGGLRLNTVTAKPACDAATRGTFWHTLGGAGVKDSVEVCAKDAADAFAWRPLY